MAKAATLRCMIAGCDFITDETLTSGGQLRQLREHWRNNEFSFQWYQHGIDPEEVNRIMEAGVTIITTLWTELDAVTGPALVALREYNAWKARHEEDPWTVDRPIEDLQKQLAMANQFKVGRGLAIALYHMSTPYFDNADDVVQHAVQRANAADGEFVFTPGTGHGHEADREWHLAKREGRPMNMPAGYPQPVEKPVEKADAPDFGTPRFGEEKVPGINPERPTQAAVAPAAPTAPPLAHKFSDEQVAGMKHAHANGFSVDRLAGAYNVSVAEMQAVLT